MILAIDISNSHITIGCMDGMKKRHVFSLSADTMRSKYEYAALIEQIWQHDRIPYDEIHGAIIASVVPPLTPVLRAAVLRLCPHVEVLIVGAGLKTGLNIRIDNPAQLGSDLAVGAVAALERYEVPVIVANLGTATAFTVIDEHARFRGGAIAPGVSISLSALVDTTSQLPRVPLEGPRSCIGNNTIDAMKSGSVIGAACLIDGMIARFEEELGRPAVVVATGTIAKIILPYCHRNIIYDNDLILRGLVIIYNKNRPSAARRDTSGGT